MGSLKFEDFLSFLLKLKLSYSKTFHKTLNYASTANIEEVMKFYNPGNKTFETDFIRVVAASEPIACEVSVYNLKRFL